MIEFSAFYLPASSNSLGLTMTTSWDHPGGLAETPSNIEIMCRGSSTKLERDRPRLSYYVCQNSATCKLIKKCQDKVRDCKLSTLCVSTIKQTIIMHFKNCNHNQHQESEEDTEDCAKENGCLRQVLRSFPLNGYLTAVCKYNGLTETGTVFDVFCKYKILNQII